MGGRGLRAGLRKRKEARNIASAEHGACTVGGGGEDTNVAVRA